MESKVTRDVILDLLPLVLADEASEDTRRLVEEYLIQDPALAKLAERAGQHTLDADVPVAVNKEKEVLALEKMKRLLFQEKLFLALAIGTTLLFIAFGFNDEGVYWLWRNSPEIGFPIFAVATLFWIAFLNVTYRLNR